MYHIFSSVTNLGENFLQAVKNNAISWEEQSSGQIYSRMINVHIYTIRRIFSLDLRISSYLVVVDSV